MYSLLFKGTIVEKQLSSFPSAVGDAVDAVVVDVTLLLAVVGTVSLDTECC